MILAIVGRIEPERPLGNVVIVDPRRCDPLGDTLAIVDANVESRRTAAERDLEARPALRNARIEMPIV